MLMPYLFLTAVLGKLSKVHMPSSARARPARHNARPVMKILKENFTLAPVWLRFDSPMVECVQASRRHLCPALRLKRYGRSGAQREFNPFWMRRPRLKMLGKHI